MNSRSHIGGIGCHCDEIHFNIPVPCNRYPSWQIYWTVSFVVRSGWIISLWLTIGGVLQDFSKTNKKMWFLIDRFISYVDRWALFPTRDRSPDKHVLCPCRLIHNHHCKKMQWYSDNQNVHHWEIHFAVHLVNHNQWLKKARNRISIQLNCSNLTSAFQCSECPLAQKGTFGCSCARSNKSKSSSNFLFLRFSSSPNIAWETTVFNRISRMKCCNRTGDIIHCITDIRWSITKNYK